MAKPAYATGAQVEHSKFGPGSVVKCDEEHIVVKFDEHGEKKFLCRIALAAIKKLDRPAPDAKKRPSKKKAAAAPAAEATAKK